MVCEIMVNKPMEKWYIHKKILQDMQSLMYKKDEMGGKFLFQKGRSNYTRKTCKKTELKEGHGDSVQVPEGFVNFHTHPIPCYIGEKTTFGWFSGEDVRETIIFAMKGTIAHLVMAVEGVYTMQISVCMLKAFIGIDKRVPKILNNHKVLDQIWKKHPHHNSEKKVEQTADILRGLIILLIEIYFRATHRFRSHDVDAKKCIKPKDYIKFVNAFEFSNMFNKDKKVSGCGDIKCGGLPVYEKNESESLDLKKYIYEYKEETDFYAVSKEGKTLHMNIPKKTLLDVIPAIKELDIDGTIRGCKGRIKKWFEMLYVPNKVTFNNKTQVFEQMGTEARRKFLEFYFKNPDKHTPKTIIFDKDPFFYFFEMRSECKAEDIPRIYDC